MDDSMLSALLIFVFGLSIAAPPSEAQAPGAEVTFTATSANVNDAGRGVKINVFRWSSEDDRNALVAAMNPPAQRGNAEGAGERGRGGAGRGAAGARGRGRGDAPAAPPNPMAAEPGDGRVGSRPSSRVHEPRTCPGAVARRSQTVLTGSGSHRYSCGGFGGRAPTLPPEGWLASTEPAAHTESCARQGA